MKMNAKRITGGEVMRKNLKKVVILLLYIMTLLSSSTADIFAATSGGRGRLIRGRFFFGCKIAALNFKKLLTFRKGLGRYAQNPVLA